MRYSTDVTISIQFLGAAGCVTGSQFLLTVGERHVLVDCGMFQGSPEETARNRMPFAFDPQTIDALLLTHAHLDHCGRIPALTRAGYTGPIHATRATVDLAEIVLRDSAKLQVEFAERWNRHHAPKAEEAAAEVESEATASGLKTRRTGTSVSILGLDGRNGFGIDGERRQATLEDVFVLLTGEEIE